MAILVLQTLTMITICLLISFWSFSGQVTLNNGEVMTLQDIQLFQQEAAPADILVFREHNQSKQIPLSQLKRINLKESISRKKGITSWLVILVERSNAKHEVEMDLIEVKGKNDSGREEVISANSINKISF